jgi:hypothetical protein
MFGREMKADLQINQMLSSYSLPNDQDLHVSLNGRSSKSEKEKRSCHLSMLAQIIKGQQMTQMIASSFFSSLDR